MQILLKAGLNPESFWVEHSTSWFDRHCMEVLLADAGMSLKSMVPPLEKCWSVTREFMRFIPGQYQEKAFMDAQNLLTDSQGWLHTNWARSRGF